MQLSFTKLSAAAAALCSLVSVVQGHSLSRAALDYFSLIDSPTINTPSHRVHAHSEFDITFSLHRNEQKVRLTLEPNHDIIPQGAFVQYVDGQGRVQRTESFDRAAHRVFKGSSWVQNRQGHWIYAGWARITVHKDGPQPHFEGAFGLNHDSHHVQMRTNYMATKHGLDPDLEPGEDDYMVVWRDSDVSEPAKGEAWDSMLDGSHDYFLAAFSDRLTRRTSPSILDRDVTVRADAGSWGALDPRSLFGKRQSIDGSGTGGNQGTVNLRNAIGNTTGCPKTKKVALMGVATDCTYTGSFNSTDSTRQNVINQINTASQVYEASFNITLGIANLTISDASCPGTAAQATPWNIGCSSMNISQRLSAFSTWRGQQQDQNSYWMLLSNCPTGEEVGLSWVGALCHKNVDNNGAAGANIVVKTNTEWQVMAHETGHTFGAVHDCDSQTCQDASIVNSQQCCPVSGSSCDAGGQFIMNPSIGGGSVNQFSPCTIGNICSAMGINSVNNTCLVDNSKVPLITAQQCGNGIVEPGEECDCGGSVACMNNQCCDGQTCKFKNNAKCDDSNDSCCNSCQFSAAGTVCRASTGACDPQETCSGSSGACPADVLAPNGQDCGSGNACASGQCTSRDLQCKQLMGTSLTDGKNDTYACDQDTCQVSCASPEFGANTCYQMQQNFLDGTVCGGNGKCQQGQCQGSTAGGQIESWISQNRPLVIGVAAGIGGLLVLLIVCCIVSMVRRRRRVTRIKKSAATASGWNGPYGHVSTGSGSGSGLVGAAWPQPQSQYWGAGQPAQAQQYGQPQMGYMGGHSVRYA